MPMSDDRFLFRTFVATSLTICIFGSFIYGAVAYKNNWQPIPWALYVYSTVAEVLNPSDRILKTDAVDIEAALSTPLPDALQPGLLLVAGDIADRETAVRVIDRDGNVIHEWRPIWSEIWPSYEGSFPSRPVEGMYLHGVELLPDGSLVANFEHQSTFRLDPCGNVLWKLDNLGHHSVHYSDDGTIWVPAEEFSKDPSGIPNYYGDVRRWTIQQLNVEGEVLRVIPVIKLLQDNDLEGLLYLMDTSNGSPSATGDTLHLNDIETFPKDMESNIFDAGDLLISLRNINTVLVVDPNNLRIKFLSVGRFLRQHDPDFIAGDRISLFDNHNVPNPENGNLASRIIELDAHSGTSTTVLDATSEASFFTEIMGVHQRLPNGNILVTASGEGRVLEYTPTGRLAWRYDNRVSDSLNRRVYMAMVLPETMDKAFFVSRRAACSN